MPTVDDTVFRAAYRALEARMKALAERDGHVYTPCPEPLGRADYVFLCMEPSLDGLQPEEARYKIDHGYRNFLPGAMGTSILHFCIRRYLCGPGQRYHITDVSKGGMPIRDAAAERNRRWDEWYPLLLEELNLVARPGLRVFAVGRQVEAYLAAKHDFPWRPVYSVVHYSPLAAAAWGKGIRNHEDAFERFRQTVTIDDLLATAEEELDEASVPPHVRRESLARVAKQRLTVSAQRLIFNYKLAFEALQ